MINARDFGLGNRIRQATPWYNKSFSGYRDERITSIQPEGCENLSILIKTAFLHILHAVNHINRCSNATHGSISRVAIFI